MIMVMMNDDDDDDGILVGSGIKPRVHEWDA